MHHYLGYGYQKQGINIFRKRYETDKHVRTVIAIIMWTAKHWKIRKKDKVNDDEIKRSYIYTQFW